MVSYLSLLLMDHHSDDCWLNSPQRVARWQLLAWERGPLWRCPVADGLLTAVLTGPRSWSRDNHCLVMGGTAMAPGKGRHCLLEYRITV